MPAVLPEDRREGIAVVDIGAQSTELVVYYGEAMYLASSVNGSAATTFTRDLAQALCLSFEDAETREAGIRIGARLEACGENIWIELPTPENREPPGAAATSSTSVLEARADELFHLVRAELARVGMDRALMGGVFLTGGGAKLPDLCDVAERELQCQARYGLPVGIVNWPESMDDPEWTTAAGLAMYSAKIKAQTERQQRSCGLAGKNSEVRGIQIDREAQRRGEERGTSISPRLCVSASKGDLIWTI